MCGFYSALILILSQSVQHKAPLGSSLVLQVSKSVKVVASAKPCKNKTKKKYFGKMNAEQMHQQMAQQQNVIIELQQQLQAIQQQVGMQQQVNQAIEARVASMNTSSISAKVAKPSTFNGGFRSNIELWLFEMNSYLDIAKVRENQKVQFVGSYLKENAAIWFKYVYEEASSQGMELTWKDVQERLLQRFRPIESGKTARVALASLRQSGSVQHYCNLFQQYVTLTGDMAEADKVFIFQRGLKPFIAREVDLREPYTLTDAMNYAIRADARNSLLFKKSAFGENNYANRVQGSRSIPMEVDNINMEQSEEDVSMSVNATYAERSSQVKRPEISDADRERCMKERRCFNCKKVGHSSKQCRSTYSKNF